MSKIKDKSRKSRPVLVQERERDNAEQVFAQGVDDAESLASIASRFAYLNHYRKHKELRMRPSVVANYIRAGRGLHTHLTVQAIAQALREGRLTVQAIAQALREGRKIKKTGPGAPEQHEPSLHLEAMQVDYSGKEIGKIVVSRRHIVLAFPYTPFADRWGADGKSATWLKIEDSEQRLVLGSIGTWRKILGTTTETST